MKKRLGLKILAISIALVMVASSVAMYSSTDDGKGMNEGGEKGITSLIPSPFIGVAGASETMGGGGGAFPEEEAGISAYVNVGHGIDIKNHFVNLTDIYDQEPWELEFDDTHILGTVSIPNFGGDVHPHLYIDVNGWIVAYFNKSENVSMIMQWSGTDKNTPAITEINTTTLADAIEDACDAVGIDYAEVKPNIKYYDFEFPNADSMILFVNTIATEGSNRAHVCIPRDALYEASYSHYGYNLCPSPYAIGYTSHLNLDDTTINTFSRGSDGMDMVYNQYDTESTLTVDSLHTIEITYSPEKGCDGGSAGVATVIIYKST